MVSPDYITRDGRGHWKANSIPQSTDELMQYTGLLDKDGNKIFEGDKLETDKGVIYTIFYSPKTARWAGKTLNVWTDDSQKYFYKSLAWVAPRSRIMGHKYVGVICPHCGGKSQCYCAVPD